jgi:hypothetical protein
MGRERRGTFAAFVFAAAVAGAVVLAPAPGAAEGNRNACGCYKDDGGNCYCDKKARCGCPGECEPKGCEEKREKDLEREIQAETKRAEQAAKAKHPAGDDESQPAPPPPPPRKAAAPTPAPRPKPAARKMTAQQRRDLARLLELYVGERPDDEARSVRDVLRDLGTAPDGAK